jgi:hypothetical protein
VVAPWNAIRTVAAFELGDADVGGLESPQPAFAVNTTSKMICRQFIVVTVSQILAINIAPSSRSLTESERTRFLRGHRISMGAGLPATAYRPSMMLLMPPGPNTKFVRVMLGKLQRTTKLDRSAGKMTLYEP